MLKVSIASLLATFLAAMPLLAAPLRAGAAKVDITHPEHPTRSGDKLFAKALVLSDGETTAVLVTVDAVSLGEIGYIKKEYLPNVRTALEKELKIKPANVLINASHCHGIVCQEKDMEERTVQVVKEAYKKLEPVKVGVGTGHEDRIMENRRLKLK